MEGLQRGPRRARRVAQNAAATRTPETTPTGRQTAAAGGQAQGRRQATPIDPSPSVDITGSGFEGTPSERRGIWGQDRPIIPPRRLPDVPAANLSPNLEAEVPPRRSSAVSRLQQRNLEREHQREMERDLETDDFIDRQLRAEGYVMEEDSDDVDEEITEPVEEVIEYGQEDEGGEDQVDDEHLEGDLMDIGFDSSALGLKEISNLGKFTVSSHKPGNGVEELRNDDTDLYWQSDGPQPHKLTVYFIKRVGVRCIRFYVDYQNDESYTPTKIIFKSGTSENNLIEFAALQLEAPIGWQQVPLEGMGGEPDGNTLACYVFQMQILENHQNGKDTHLRGIKIYAADTDPRVTAAGGANPMADMVDLIDNPVLRRRAEERALLGDVLDDDDDDDDDDEYVQRQLRREERVQLWESSDNVLGEPAFMREQEIR